MDDVEQQASHTVKKIERYERNWHIFKTVFLAIGVVVIITIQFYTFSRLLNNSNTNRQLVCDIVKQVEINNNQIMQDCK